MDKQVIDFLDTERLSALTIMVNDETLHPATMHFSYTTEPEFKIFFSTDKNTRKAEKIRLGDSAQAAVVIGFSEKDWKTLQAGGEISVVTDQEQVAQIKQHHYSKNTSSARYKDDPATAMLVFTPKWWRFSNFKTNPVTTFAN